MTVLVVWALLLQDPSAEDRLLLAQPPSTPGELPRLSPFVISPLGWSAAYVEEDRTVNPPYGVHRVVVDDTPQEWFDEIKAPAYSGDGKSLAYYARTEKKWYLIVDGKKISEAVDGVGHSIVPEPSGKKFAAALKKGDKWFVLEGSTKGPLVDELGPGILWTRSGAVYVAGLKDDKSLQVEHCVVAGAKRGKVYFSVDSLCVSPDAKNYAYIGRNIGEKSGSYVVVGTKVSDKTNAGSDSLRWNPNSSAVAYVVLDGGASHVRVGDKKHGDTFDTVSPPVFSPDGKVIAYAARNSSRSLGTFLVVNDKVIKTQAPVERIAFAADGKTPVYVEGKHLAFGEKPGPDFDHPLERAFYLNPKDDTSACIYEDKSRNASRAFLKVGPDAFGPFARVHEGAWGPDGKTFVFLATALKDPDNVTSDRIKKLFIGKQELGYFDEICTPLIFLDGGAKVAFGARIGLELWWKVVDTK